FRFDSPGDVVRIPDSTDLNFGANSPMTVEFWAYSMSTNATMHLFGKRQPNCGAVQYQIAADAKNGGLGFFCRGGSVTTGLQLPLNTWTHLAATFDGQSFRFYINGVLVATGSGNLGAPVAAPL